MFARALSRSVALVSLSALAVTACRTTAPPINSQTDLTADSPALKRYKNTVEDQLGSHWYRLVAANVDELDLGTVQTRFEIPAAGGVARRIRIRSNTGNLMDAKIALLAIEQLRAPPIPPAVLKQIGKEDLALEESFTIYPQSDAHSHLLAPSKSDTPNARH